MMNKMSAPLSGLLRDNTPSATEVERLWAEHRALRGEKRRSRWIFVSALALAALVLGVWGVRRPSKDLHLAGGQELALIDADSERSVAFEDSSSVVLEAGASLQPVVTTGRDVDFVLRRGALRFVIKDSGRRWSIHAGGTVVQTSQARFALYRTESGVDVVVQEGEVVLRGANIEGSVKYLGPSSRFHVEHPKSPPERAPEESPPPKIPVPSKIPVQAVHPRVPPSRLPIEPITEPQVASEAADLAFPTVPSPGETLDELLQRADALRLAGRPNEALPILERAQRAPEFAGNPKLGIVAFTRGRIYADDQKDSRLAAQAFAEAVTLGLPNALVESAYLRLVETRSAGGDRPGAISAAKAYLERFPKGREHARMERLLQDVPR